MLLDLRELVRDHQLDIGGVVHVGAHLAEEVGVYDELGLRPIFWIEANPAVIPRIKENIKGYVGQHVINALVTDHRQQLVPFYVTNYEGMSSSVYKFGTHSQFSPDTIVEGTLELPSTLLDHLNDEYNFEGCNMFNIDIEGAGLLALKGATHLLKQMDIVYMEIQTENVFDGAPLLDEVESFLRDFKLVDLGMVPDQGWGDALFVRKIA